MNGLVLILASIAFGLLFVSVDPAKAYNLISLYQKYGQRYKIDPDLLRAVAIVESSENPKAVNPSDPSYGLMQVLCRSNGKGSCSNQFNVTGWPPRWREDLLEPDYNLSIASQILTWNIRQYGLKKGVACYNNWSARFDPKEGPFQNQGYVNKVFFEYDKIKKT